MKIHSPEFLAWVKLCEMQRAIEELRYGNQNGDSKFLFQLFDECIDLAPQASKYHGVSAANWLHTDVISWARRLFAGYDFTHHQVREAKIIGDLDDLQKLTFDSG